jgi:hypothetical protein
MATALWTSLTVWRVDWNARPDTLSRNFAGNLIDATIAFIQLSGWPVVLLAGWLAGSLFGRLFDGFVCLNCLAGCLSC